MKTIRSNTSKYPPHQWCSTLQGGSTELDTMLWSELPFEIMERVLSYVPVPDLCRYRSVCQSWNRLIQSPEFGAICTQQRAAKRDAPSFLAMRCLLGQPEETAREAWCFLSSDKRRRWYTVEDEHPELSKEIRGYWVADMDGGLICKYTKPSNTQRMKNPSNKKKHMKHFSIIVYSPIAKAVKELPSVPRHQKSTRYATLTLAVDDTTQRFKVFLINQNVFLSTKSLATKNDPLMRIYDSATNEWQGATDPFCQSRVVGLVSCSVVFQGFLYATFGSVTEFGACLHGGPDDLWRYDIEEDAWEKVNLNVPGLPATHFGIQLFVIANRLFKIGWMLNDPSRTSDEARYVLSEIKFPGMILEELFDISESELYALFSDESHCPRNPDSDVASVFVNSILLICKSSHKIMALDLETRIWEQLPANPKWTQPEQEFDCGRDDYFADPILHMNLILPSSLDWCR